LSAFAGVVAIDGAHRSKPLPVGSTPVAAGTRWRGSRRRIETSGREELDGAADSWLRPQAHIASAWWRAERVRILSTSCLEAALVAEESTDAFADAGSDTHRIVDLAATMVTVPAAGGAVIDVYGRPLEIDTDLTRRWSGSGRGNPAIG
jgi:myo-inositol-1(or 4)-monophosphatase